MTGNAVPIGLQLYTLRESLADDRLGTMRSVADMGYAGVEPFGLDPESALAMRELCDQFGLAIPSVHAAMPLGERRDEVIETVLALGAPRLVSGLGPSEFQDRDALLRACDSFNEAHENAAAHGLTFGIHNHWWEYEVVDGLYPYRVLLERLDPAVFFELDIYWANTAGVRSQDALRELAGRVPLLHVKDGPATKDEPMTAVGQGSLDIPAIVRANEAHNEWLLVELDRCASDMLTAVEESFRYLVDNGLGVGRDPHAA